MADAPKPASAQDVIDTLKGILRGIDRLCAHFGCSGVPVNSNVPSSRPAYDVPQIATDRDLDSQYGDPFIKAKDPRDWTGDSMLGRPFSECPPEYLDLLADRFDYFAEQAEAEGRTTSAGKPVAPYNRKDAARARGWAKRLRGGWKPPAQDESAPAFPSDLTEPAQQLSDDEIAF